MAINYKAVINQIDLILADCNPKSPKHYADFSDLPAETRSAVISRLTAAINRFAPRGSSYLLAAATEQRHLVGITGSAISPLRGILSALRDDYAAGFMQSIESLINANLFSDFLEMAKHLLDQGFKDPAAVITGSVIEQHLRKLSLKANLSLVQISGAPKKADTLNAELASANVYAKLDQKSVIAWLDLRNKAAHGHYDEYTKEQVTLMLQGVMDFVSRHPA